MVALLSDFLFCSKRIYLTVDRYFIWSRLTIIIFVNGETNFLSICPEEFLVIVENDRSSNKGFGGGYKLIQGLVEGESDVMDNKDILNFVLVWLKIK